MFWGQKRRKKGRDREHPPSPRPGKEKVNGMKGEGRERVDQIGEIDTSSHKGSQLWKMIFPRRKKKGESTAEKGGIRCGPQVHNRGWLRGERKKRKI